MKQDLLGHLIAFGLQNIDIKSAPIGSAPWMTVRYGNGPHIGMLWNYDVFEEVSKRPEDLGVVLTLPTKNWIPFFGSPFVCKEH
jgi:hypothetical protein